MPGEVEAEIRAALPAGAVVEGERQVSWSLASERHGLYGVRYTLDGRPSVAAVAVRPPRLLWDLRRDGPADLVPTGAWPLHVTSIGLGRQTSPAVAVGTADGPWLLTLSFEGEPDVRERLPLPPAVDPQDLEGQYVPWVERDLTGDGETDLALGLDEKDGRAATLLYHRLDDGSVRLAEVVEPGAMLLDLDRDGLLEIVVPQGESIWSVRRWMDDGFAQAETLSEPSAPIPQPVADDQLPPLPGALTFHRAGEGAVWRWPSEGGALRALWRAEEGGPGLRGIQVSTDGSRMLYALQAPEPAKPPAAVFLALQDVASGRILGSPRRLASGTEQKLRYGIDLRGYALSSDGQRVVYVAFGIGPDGRALPTPPPDQRSSAGESGTVFSFDAADPSRLEAVAPCEAHEVQTHLTLDCSGEVALTADGARTAWADARGVWVAELPRGEPRKALDHFFVDPEVEVGSRIYSPERWSPDARRLILHVGHYEGSSNAILEPTTGEFAEIRDTGSGYGTWTELAWYPDSSRLLVAGWRGETALRIVDVADPDAARPLLGDTLALSPEGHQHAIGPAIAPDGGLRFGLRHADAAVWRGNGIFRAAPDGSEIVRLAALPPVAPDENDDLEPGELSWSPDGDAFLMRFVEDGEPRALVGLADGSGLWDASDVLGAIEWAAWSR